MCDVVRQYVRLPSNGDIPSAKIGVKKLLWSVSYRFIEQEQHSLLEYIETTEISTSCDNGKSIHIRGAHISEVFSMLKVQTEQENCVRDKRCTHL